MDFNFETPNLAALEARLLEMGTTTARAAGRKALRQGANVILAESRRLVSAGHPAFPQKITGLMARSLYTHDRGIMGDNIVFSVDLKKLAFYGRFVEFGTSKSRAYPFMRPAAEHKAEEAVRVMAETLQGVIELSWGRPL
ncbi:MAG TPA: HK97-gp10 family putative phage morphogenesis protein [Telluria sp.]|nr:HK97-gp10 family putative phage morphogenesis protein [Telluria sp.]